MTSVLRDSEPRLRVMECRALGWKPVAFSEWAGGQQEMALSDLGSEEEPVASGLVQENSQELGDRWPGSATLCLSLSWPDLA